MKELLKEAEKERHFTLSDLLEILDGMIESDGRMIVFTTNHPENLDPALLRPGNTKISQSAKMGSNDPFSRSSQGGST
jgi:chaperone BCS1